MGTSKTPVNTIPDAKLGTVPGTIHKLSVIHKSYIIDALAKVSQDKDHIFIIVSVMKEDGTPVTGLEKENFRAGLFITDPNENEVWLEAPVYWCDEMGTNKGVGAFRISVSNESNLGENMIFSVEVFNDERSGENKVMYRGQGLAYVRQNLQVNN